MKVSSHCALNSLTSFPWRDYFSLLLWLKTDCWRAPVAPRPWRQSSESQEQVWVNGTPLTHRPCPISSCKGPRVSHSFISFSRTREEGLWHKCSALFDDFVRLAFNAQGATQGGKARLRLLEGSAHCTEEGTLHSRKHVGQRLLHQAVSPVTLFSILFRASFSLLREGRNAEGGMVNCSLEDGSLYI